MAHIKAGGGGGVYARGEWVRSFETLETSWLNLTKHKEDRRIKERMKERERERERERDEVGGDGGSWFWAKNLSIARMILWPGLVEPVLVWVGAFCSLTNSANHFLTTAIHRPLPSLQIPKGNLKLQVCVVKHALNS